VQKEPWFLKLNPNGRIPVLVDNKVDNGSSEPFSVMETAACLFYLLKKVDKKDALGFKDDLERNECIQ
jgi:glutathione S-transferase